LIISRSSSKVKVIVKVHGHWRKWSVRPRVTAFSSSFAIEGKACNRWTINRRRTAIHAGLVEEGLITAIRRRIIARLGNLRAPVEMADIATIINRYLRCEATNYRRHSSGQGGRTRGCSQATWSFQPRRRGLPRPQRGDRSAVQRRRGGRSELTAANEVSEIWMN